MVKGKAPVHDIAPFAGSGDGTLELLVHSVQAIS